MIFGSPDTPRANYMTDDRELRENYEPKALNLSDLDDITAEDIEAYYGAEERPAVNAGPGG